MENEYLRASASATVSVFSAKDFLIEQSNPSAIPTGGLQTFELSLPATGLILAPQEDSEAWRRGIALASAKTESFVTDVKRGECPPIIQPPLRAPYIPTHYYSPESLLQRACTVADALHLTPAIVGLIASCDQASCPQCNATVALFSSVEELLRAIGVHYAGSSLVLSIVGPSHTIESWALSKGFEASFLTPVLSSATIDSFVCSEGACLTKVDLVASLITAEGVALRCTTQAAEQLYALSGACLKCHTVLPKLSRREITKSLNSAEPLLAIARQKRSLSGLLVADLVTLPMSELINHPHSSDILSAELQKELALLSLDSLRLTDKPVNLDHRHLAGLALLSLAYDPRPVSHVRILDLPSASLRASLRLPATQVLKRSAHSSLCILLNDPFAAAPNTQPPTLESRPINFHSQTSQSHTPVTRITLLPKLQRRSGLVAHALGLSEPLAELYATSTEARVLGLSARSFLISASGRGSSECTCDQCLGYGFVINEDLNIPVIDAAPCTECWATRFKAPVSSIRFRGTTLGQLYNHTLESALPIARALPRSARALRLADQLGLMQLPLGLPLTLLSRAEQRLILFAQAILRSPKNSPSLIIFEDIHIGLSAEQQALVQRIEQSDDRGASTIGYT
jgi:hypothetical protein